jgi:hypothetical protein
MWAITLFNNFIVDCIIIVDLNGAAEVPGTKSTEVASQSLDIYLFISKTIRVATDLYCN